MRMSQPSPRVSDMAEKMTLTAALERYKKLTDRHGCTDGGCVVQRPTGMHTNGGCRCSRDPHTAQRVMYAAQIMADAIAAHIAQPAQAVDVGAIRKVVAQLTEKGVLHAPYATRAADKLTRAIGNAQAEGWSVPETGRFALNERVQFNNGKHVFTGYVHRIEYPYTIYHVQMDDGTHYACYGEDPKVTSIPTPLPKATPNAHE